jgi:hypothetical protein
MIFGSGGIFFITVAICEKLRVNNWQKTQLYYIIVAAIFISIFMGVMAAALLQYSP